MNNAIAEFAAHAISKRIGLSVTTRIIPGDSPCLEVLPTESHPNDAFAVHLTIGWRSATVDFHPGKFSAPLIFQMGKAGDDAKSAATAFISALLGRKYNLSLRINGADIPPLDTAQWPVGWNKFEFQARSPMQVMDANDIGQMRQLVVELLVPTLGIITALIGLEEPDMSAYGELEGNCVQTLVTRFERKKINREACIQLKGYKCIVCGFDFSSSYGPLGVGYIEIHHTTPVSQVGPNYRIDVVTDLEPLCANCHAMVHREDPPVPIDRMKALVASRGPCTKESTGTSN